MRDAVSYAPNAYLKTWWLGTQGPINAGGDWVGGSFAPWVTSADVQRPSETILLGEVHNTVIQAKKFDGNGIQGSPVFIGSTAMSWFNTLNGLTPDGTLPKTNAYPTGPDGMVTPQHAQMANFAFVDGHVKAMRPERTNPDPVNRPQDNMWDARRK